MRVMSLRFNGSLWCNLDVALRNIDSQYRQYLNGIGLTVVEWYVLRALFEQDGQHASELAHAVGRAATSFTPNLDKLQSKGLIERKPDPNDRRAVRIFLTDKAKSKQDKILQKARTLDDRFASMIDEDQFQVFQDVLATLQTAKLN